jgi:(4S)-4-hydroxy-5-phosphonooxypentane-2,3-dione isomerase
MKVIVVKFELKPEYRQQFLDASLGDASGSVHDEPGCRRFDVVQDRDDPNRIFFYEVYDDEAAFAAHTRAPHYIRWRDSISPDWYAQPSQAWHAVSTYPSDAEWV